MIAMYTHMLNHNGNDFKAYDKVIREMINNAPIFTLQLTVLTNLYNWSFYYIKIREMAVISRKRKGLKI